MPLTNAEKQRAYRERAERRTVAKLTGKALKEYYDGE